MPVARATVDIDVAPERVMAVITDFARYPTFLGEMSEATILRRDGKLWVVKFAVSVVRRLEYTLQLEQTSDTTLCWSLVEGAFLANRGSWTLSPTEKGTHAVYDIELEIGMFVPGSVMKTILQKSLPATMAAFKKESERTP